MVKAIPCFNGPAHDRRRPHGHRRAPFFCADGPRPHAKRASKTGLQQPPERPLLQPSMQEGWSSGGTAAASKYNRLPDLQGGAQTGVPRPLAHTQRGRGWAVACGRFALTLRLGLMFYAASRPARAPNRHPPRPPEAPRRARGSPLCARGEAKVSCDPRSGVGGGVRKTGGCRIGQGLGSASGQGSGQVWACGHFSTGFPPAQRRCIGASGAPSRHGAARSTLSGALRPPLMNLL